MSVLQNARIYVAQYHLSGDMNRVELETGVDEQDGMTFLHTARCTKGTVPFVNLSGGGFVTLGNGNVHEALRSKLAVANVPITVCPTDAGVDGSIAEFFLALAARYQAGGPVGRLMPFTLSAKGQGVPSVPGRILATGAKTVTANGTARQLGAVAAAQKVYAALHVIAVSGTNPTLDVVVASDNAEGFGSGATRLTFGQKTAAGSEFLSLQGPITDDWWRAQWTVGGTDNPSFDVVVAVGIEQ